MEKASKQNNSKNKEYANSYRAKYKDYSFHIEWTDLKPIDPDLKAVDVVLETNTGQKYVANFVTLRFLDYMFEKNINTGECVSGTYFAMPGMIIVRRIDDKSLKATIDDLIENLELEEYFKIRN